MKRLHATFVVDDEDADQLLDMLTTMMRNPNGWITNVGLSMNEPSPPYDGFVQKVPTEPRGHKGFEAKVRVDTVGWEQWF